MLDVAPDDVKRILTWLHGIVLKVIKTETTKHLDRLKQLSPESASKLEKVFAVIDKAANQPITDKLEAKLPAQSAIITLGYALNPDGSMHDILVQRLEKTLEIANQNPDALIIVTGGVPQK